MSVLFASLIKEWRLLLRDAHALLVLFLMPAVFIVIMSLALAEQLDGLAVYLVKHHAADASGE